MTKPTLQKPDNRIKSTMLKLITIGLIATPMLVEAKYYGFATLSFMLFLFFLMGQVADEIRNAVNTKK